MNEVLDAGYEAQGAVIDSGGLHKVEWRKSSAVGSVPFYTRVKQCNVQCTKRTIKVC